jgi:hypothetical protein
MTPRAGTALAATLLATLTLSACETTQQESAKIGRKLGHQSADAGTTGIGTPSRSVHVAAATLLAGAPGAVALELRNDGSAQADVPVGVAVRDAKGTVVYRNDTKGIEASLQELSLLPAHATVWWVDNEVLASGGAATRLSAAVGAARGRAPANAPTLTAAGVSASNSFPGPHVDLTVRNASGSAQTQVTLYAVATAGGKVVGAGRAIVAALPAAAGASVEIPMTGAVAGATISVTIAPAAP